jgi:multiple sugar transport system permease protein
MGNIAATQPVKRKRRHGSLMGSRWEPGLFVAPAVILLFVVTIVPFVIELILSFTTYELTKPAPPTFVWLKNYRDVFVDPRFWNSMKVTFIFIFGGVGMELVLGVGLAMVLNRLNRSRSLIMSLLLIPVMVAPVVSGMMWVIIYDDKFGPLNYLIQLISGGVLRGPPWRADLTWSLVALIIADIWQWTPFIILIVLAGLQSIPVEMYEAGEVDGCGGWQSFRFLTLPLLVPVLVVGVLIRFMDAFKMFDLVYVITNGGPASATETISYYTYVRGFKQFSIGYAAALAFVQLIVIILVAKFFIGYLNRMRKETT